MFDEVLRFEDVTVRRGPSEILSAVNWQVQEGQQWALLGPNGAGKTTLLRIAAAELHPSSGRVHLLGEQLGKVDVFELRPRIGFSSAALASRMPPRESVFNAVATGAYAITGRWRETYEAADEERAAELMAAFGISDLARRTFGTLSEGERKRVLIARSLMADPEVLLLDEPAAGLDLGAREELIAAIDSLACDPRAPVMVLVTHHVEEIPASFTHAALLSQGQLVVAGPIEQALTSQTLSAAFALPLQLDRHHGRWTARAVRNGTEPV
jgi:iron complex transport system ATP-binding protein